MLTVEIDGEELRRHRRAKGLKQGELDTAAGLEKGRTTLFERHVVKPRPEELMSIAQALDIPSDLLVTENEKNNLFATIGTVGKLLRVRVSLDPENNVNTIIC
jgi:transcriptional regulator with XRE-family HTH domain